MTELYDIEEENPPMFDPAIMAEVEALHGAYCPICGSGDEKQNIKLCRNCYFNLLNY